MDMDLATLLCKPTRSPGMVQVDVSEKNITNIIDLIAEILDFQQSDFEQLTRDRFLPGLLRLNERPGMFQ